MAGSVIFVSWGTTVGKGEQASSAFNSVIRYYTRFQEQGTISSVMPVLLEPRSELIGFILIQGGDAQLASLRAGGAIVPDFAGELTFSHLEILPLAPADAMHHPVPVGSSALEVSGQASTAVATLVEPDTFEQVVARLTALETQVRGIAALQSARQGDTWSRLHDWLAGTWANSSS